MANVTLMETADGRRYYRIRVSRGRGQSPYQTRWYIPEGWTSAKKIKSALDEAVAEFKLKCKAGEIQNRAEKEAAKKTAEAEAAKIKTLRQYVDGVFMPTKEATLSENGRSSYRMMLDKHILPALGDFALPEIAPPMVSKFLLEFQRKGYSHATTVKVYNILNGVFDMAFMDGSINISPMLRVKRPAPRKDEHIADETELAYTAAEIATIFSHLSEEPLKWQAFITLAADSGARRGELCGLQWADIDWEQSTMCIRRNLQYSKEKKERDTDKSVVYNGVYITSPKNGKARVVDIGADTLAMLRKLRAEQAASCVSKWVFTQDGSADPMFPSSPTRYFKRFGERYGIADFHPHKLRHTSASIAITNRADPVSVSKRLGHSDPAFTMRRYAHANQESVRCAGQLVRDIIKAQNE